MNSNITINYKTPPAGTCTTVFPAQKQYTGYVTLPPFTLAPIQQNYTVNSFFWFVEARTNAAQAPLTVYINGGPGSSSLVGLFQETGPCEVIEVARGKLGTQAREWGWDRSSNVLYIDQPNLVGYSYDQGTNGTLNLVNGNISESGSEKPESQPEFTFLDGTFSSNNPNHTANTTEIAAHAVWHMLQSFLGAFPQYNSGSTPNVTASATMGVNLFAESYGGKYGPAFASLWEEMNEGRRNGSIAANKTVEIKLLSLGIMQGCVDDLVQGRYYPIFASNNTYGIKALDLIQQQEAASSFLRPNGCQDLIERCRSLVTSQDLLSYGDSDAVNNACQIAQETCNDEVVGPYQNFGRDMYDISQTMPDPFPSTSYLEYLNNADVQAGIGAPINFTQTSTAVTNAFKSTGDYDRGSQISDLAYLLSLGVRVAFIYGDRDYICNWLGGEAVSFAVAGSSPSLSPFYTAGYAEIVTNSSYVGGVVRQYGNLSFSRIYDAGHLIPAYQPETAFTVFTRVIRGTEISTGMNVDLRTYVSNGTANATHQNQAPPQYPAKCYIRNMPLSCTSDQISKLTSGAGTVINGIWYENEDDWAAPPASISMFAGLPGTLPLSKTASPASSSSGGKPTPPPVSTPMATGVFVATATPSSSSSDLAPKATQVGRWAVGLAPLAAVALAI